MNSLSPVVVVVTEKTPTLKTILCILYISQNFIMARFAAFERIKLHQILKPASTSP